jgi:hypothetical protein
MPDIYEQRAREQRSPGMQSFIDTLAEDLGIEQMFIEASEHPSGCSCEKCLHWWSRIGPEDEENPSFGPFSQEQVEAYCKENGLDIWWGAENERDRQA